MLYEGLQAEVRVRDLVLVSELEKQKKPRDVARFLMVVCDRISVFVTVAYKSCLHSSRTEFCFVFFTYQLLSLVSFRIVSL